MLPCAPLHRLFFALKPPTGAAAAIEHDTAWLGSRHRVGQDRLHITLNILEDSAFQPLPVLQAMLRIGDAVAAEPFRVVFDQLSGSPHSVVLRPSERIGALFGFQRLLAARLARAGIAARGGFRFSPHLTLLYEPRPGFVAPANPVSWRVSEFVLIESLVGWSEHRVHRSWRLV